MDAHATTPCDPLVVDALLPFLKEDFGNAASTQHAWGRYAAERVEGARQQVADLLACEPAEIVFTSGATESDNLALFGTVEWTLRRTGRAHLVTAVTEHKAVLDACGVLEARGVDVTYLDVESDGRIEPAAVERALRDDTVLVSLMVANNEIGVVHPIAEIAEICRRRDVLLHADAAQALATEDCGIPSLGVDLLSISGHKMYGPKGVGALYVRRRRPRVRLEPQTHGGGHERGRRSGTLDVPAIVGLGTACQLAGERRDADSRHLVVLRDHLLEGLRQAFPDLQVHGSLSSRLPHNLNVSLPGVEARALLEEVRDLAFASGSACTSSSADGSYVVKTLIRSQLRESVGSATDPSDVMEAAEDAASRALRFGLLRTATRAEIDRAIVEIVRAARLVQSTAVGSDPWACAPESCERVVA